MSKFYNKMTVEIEWGAMMASAKSHFETYNQKNHKFHQCLIMDTTKQGIMTYPIVADSMEELTKQEELIVANLEGDTICRIICMWQNNCIDVPSFYITKKVCEINKQNKAAEILLSAGTDAYVTKRIDDIIG